MEIRKVESKEELMSVIKEMVESQMPSREEIAKKIDEAEGISKKTAAIKSLLDKMGCDDKEALTLISLVARVLTKGETEPVTKDNVLSTIEEHHEELVQNMVITAAVADMFDTTSSEVVARKLASTLSAVATSGDKFVKDAIAMVTEESHECTNCGKCGKGKDDTEGRKATGFEQMIKEALREMGEK